MEIKAECCNADCGWTGLLSECLRWKHDTGVRFCPECHEVVEGINTINVVGGEKDEIKSMG